MLSWGVVSVNRVRCSRAPQVLREGKYIPFLSAPVASRSMPVNVVKGRVLGCADWGMMVDTHVLGGDMKQDVNPTGGFVRNDFTELMR